MIKNFLYSLHVFFLLLTFPSMASQVETERFQQFIKEIRCVVCKNQSLADSNAPLAQDLRQKIDALMQHKKTNEEIKNYLVKRYGEFILLKPRFNALTWYLWLFPMVGFVIAFAHLWYFFLRQQK